MNKKTEAKCTGDTLMVGFHGATPPLIWRFDLERNHSFTLALQGEEGEWELGLTTPKGDFYAVAHFTGREEAEEAFARVEKILARRRSGWALIGRTLLGLAAVLAVIAAGVIGFGLYATYAGHRAALPLAASSTPVAPSSAPPLMPGSPLPEGVPLPADQVLKPPAP